MSDSSTGNRNGNAKARKLMVTPVNFSEALHGTVPDPTRTDLAIVVLGRGAKPPYKLAMTFDFALRMVRCVADILASNGCKEAQYMVGDPSQRIHFISVKESTRRSMTRRFAIPSPVLPPNTGPRTRSDQVLYREAFVGPERKVRKRGAENMLRELFDREPALARFIEDRMDRAFEPLTREMLNPETIYKLWAEVLTLVLSTVNTVQHWQKILWEDVIKSTPVAQLDPDAPGEDQEPSHRRSER